MAGLGRRSHYRKHLTDSVLYDYPEPDASQGERVARILGSRGGNLFEVAVAPPVYNRGREQNKAGHDDDDVVRVEEESGGDDGEDGDGADGAADGAVTRISAITDDGGAQMTSTDLAILPTKFRKLVWVKRGDYVIITMGTDPSQFEAAASTNKVRYMIRHVLYGDQVRHVRSVGLWPPGRDFNDGDGDNDDVVGGGSAAGNSKREEEREAPRRAHEKDGEGAGTGDAAALAATTAAGTNGVAGPGGGAPSGDDRGDGDEGSHHSDDGEEEIDDEQDDSDLFVNTNRVARMRVVESDSSEDSDTSDDY